MTENDVAPEQPSEPERFALMPLCPVCASVSDVECHDGEKVSVDCATCETEYSFTVSIKTVREHAI